MRSSRNTNTNIFLHLHACLCGSDWKIKTTMAKDVQLLLREVGASMLSSGAKAAKFNRGELEILLQHQSNDANDADGAKDAHSHAQSPRVIL